MKAVLIHSPGHASYGEQPEPYPQTGQVLVRVEAAGICFSDVEILDGTRPEPYVKYPIIPGHEWCGTVVAVGPGVSEPQVGQRVAVEGHNFCRLCFWCQRGETNLCVAYNEFGFTLPGGYAEYVAARADLAHPFAESLPFEVAALTEPAACAGQGFSGVEVQPDDTVAVVGPGTIGLLAVAWAKLLNAKNIVVIGLDRANEARARSVGATHYLTTGDDPMAFGRELTAGRGADVVFEAAGNERAVTLALDLVRRGGHVVLAGIAGNDRTLSLASDLFCLKALHVHGVFAYSSASFVRTLKLIENGRLNVSPLITHRFPLQEYAHAFELLPSRSEPVVKILLTPGYLS